MAQSMDPYKEVTTKAFVEAARIRIRQGKTPKLPPGLNEEELAQFFENRAKVERLLRETNVNEDRPLPDDPAYD